MSVTEKTARAPSAKVRRVTVPWPSIDCTALVTRFWITFDSASASAEIGNGASSLTRAIRSLRNAGRAASSTSAARSTTSRRRRADSGAARSRPSSAFMRSTVLTTVRSASRWNSGSSKFFSAFSLSIESAEIEFLRSWITNDVSRWNASNSRDRARLSESRALTMAPTACSATVSMNSRSSLVYGTPVCSGPIRRKPVSSSRQCRGTSTDPSGNAAAVGDSSSAPVEPLSSTRGARRAPSEAISGCASASVATGRRAPTAAVAWCHAAPASRR